MFDLLENSHLEINVTHNKTNIIMEFENQLDEKKRKKKWKRQVRQSVPSGKVKYFSPSTMFEHCDSVFKNALE